MQVALLQWRAGQLPGQTIEDGDGGAQVVESRFNGGPGNCPAKLTRTPHSEWIVDRFNGGPGNCPAKQGDP